MISYIGNYADTTGSPYHYKIPDQIRNNNGVIQDINDSSTSFKYQSSLIKKQVNSATVVENRDPVVTDAHRAWKNVKIAVPLKYINNFYRALELPLINTQLHAELNWTKTK